MKGKWIWILFLIGTGFIIGWQISRSIFDKKNTVIMAGSVAMETFALGIEEMMEQLNKESKQKNNFTVTSEFIGSSAGMEALLKGKAQIAMVSRYLTEEEKAKGIVENIVAYDGIVMIVNKENPIDNLSREALAAIFTGKITNWQQLGGKEEPIITIGRELGSGTRDSFEAFFGITGESCYSNECDSIGVLKMKVELLSGAIGYVSREVASESTEKIKIVAVEQKVPNQKNIESGEYFLVRPFILATKGEINQQKEPIQKIFQVLDSEQGEMIFETAKVVSARNRKFSGN